MAWLDGEFPLVGKIERQVFWRQTPLVKIMTVKSAPAGKKRAAAPPEVTRQTIYYRNNGYPWDLQNVNRPPRATTARALQM